VASHILAEHEELARKIEQSAGMQATGAIEGFLRRGKRLRQSQEHLRINLAKVLDRCKLLANRFDGRFTADAATRGGENVTSELLEVQRFWLTQPHVDHIALRQAQFRSWPGSPFAESCSIERGTSAGALGLRNQAMRAVPHVNIEIKVADRDGSPHDCIVPFRYTFDGKEYWDSHGNLDMPTTGDGRLVLRVPHGASRLDGSAMARGAICLCRNSKEAKNKQFANGPMFAYFNGIDEDKTLDILWIR